MEGQCIYLPHEHLWPDQTSSYFWGFYFFVLQDVKVFLTVKWVFQGGPKGSLWVGPSFPCHSCVSICLTPFWWAVGLLTSLSAALLFVLNLLCICFSFPLDPVPPIILLFYLIVCSSSLSPTQLLSYFLADTQAWPVSPSLLDQQKIWGRTESKKKKNYTITKYSNAHWN